MSGNSFMAAFTPSNAEFERVAGESFEVASGATLGTYVATSIDDLSTAAETAPGGARALNEVDIYVSLAVFTASAMAQSAVLVVRGSRVRVKTIGDDGDDARVLHCGSVGIKL